MTARLDDALDEHTVDGAGWWAQTTLKKWYSDDDFLAGKSPDEVITLERNKLVNAGINRLSNLICGVTTSPYGAAARIGVGDSSTPWVVTQTGLQAATNKALVTVQGAPVVSGTPATMQWVGVFPPGTGEWGTGWQEWCVDNGAGAAETLNRFVQSLGTKTGGTWTLTVTLGIT